MICATLLADQRISSVDRGKEIAIITGSLVDPLSVRAVIGELEVFSHTCAFRRLLVAGHSEGKGSSNTNVTPNIVQRVTL